MTQTHRPILAVLWMIASIGGFLSMAVAGRAVTGLHDTFEIMTWRSLVSLIMVGVILTATRRWSEVKGNRIGHHFARNAAHFAGQNLWFLALSLIPLAQVFALEFTSPIWVILLAPVFLGEHVTRTRLLAGALGFAGALIVARPDFGHVDPGVLAAAGAAVCFAATAILTKKLTRHETIMSILFWLALMQLIMGTISAGLDGHIGLPTRETLIPLLIIGAAGLFGHFCLTKALSLAPASTVVPVDFLRLPLAAMLGLWLYGEVVALTVYLGAVLILAGIWLNLRAGDGAAATALRSEQEQ